MSPFVLVVSAVMIGDLAWWQWADRRLKRRTRRPWLWRTLLGLFTLFQLGYVTWFITFPSAGRHAHFWMPAPVLATVYLWHLLILPATLLVLIPAEWSALLAFRRMRKRSAAGEVVPEDFKQPRVTRRQALASAVVAVPPLLTAVSAARAMGQVRHFRVHEVELPLPQLPRELDGMTIAHVTDLHIGRFTRAKMLPAIADATNALRADLVLLTGDLIDLTLSDLPTGLDFVSKLDPRSGLFMVEGNHDLIESPAAFEFRVRQAGVPLLLDEDAVVKVRGRDVQLLGMTWGRGDAYHVGAMGRLNPLRRPDAFPILLAHHPHAFDPAAAVGIPLTLSGHTHGGQIMLNERLGMGPAMFRYWSGLYRKGNSALYVSNGVGNWFPLRIGAPAEIVHLTLRSTQSA
jgi:predicted MPP superfamily phosphohydrolase